MKRSTSKAPVSSARSTLRKSIVDYQDSLRQRDLAPSTLTTYNRGLRNFLAFLENEGCRFITDIRSEHLIRFRVWARERSKPYRIRHASSGEGAATTYAQAARGWCHWLYRTDQLLLDPCARLAPDSRSRRIPRALTHQEVETLLEVIKVEDPVSLRDQAILDLLYSSGLRVGELCALDLADLDLA